MRFGTTMAPHARLFEFFLGEIEEEERLGFPRVGSIPDSYTTSRLAYYRQLNEQASRSFRECSALFACRCYGFVVNAPPFDHTQHAFFERWVQDPWWLAVRNGETCRSVPMLRAQVQQYKMDLKAGRPSSVSYGEFNYASTVRSIKAPELRKRVRAALTPLGFYKLDELKRYCCRQQECEFRVSVDFGGRSSQLRYGVYLPDFERSNRELCMETALGFGMGNWDYIVEENVDQVFAIFSTAIEYCLALPERLRMSQRD